MCAILPQWIVELPAVDCLKQHGTLGVNKMCNCTLYYELPVGKINLQHVVYCNLPLRVIALLERGTPPTVSRNLKVKDLVAKQHPTNTHTHMYIYAQSVVSHIYDTIGTMLLFAMVGVPSYAV